MATDSRVSWESRITAYAASMPRRADRAVDKLGRLGERIARARARVRTGRMRERIQWEGRVDQLQAGAPYTPYQEHGTRYITAHPMFEPAEDAMLARAGAEFADAFEIDSRAPG